MAKMEYSMTPQDVSIGFTNDTLDGTNVAYYVPLSSLESIADVMGDGWDTDEITSTSELTYHYRQGNNTRNLAIDKYLPVLKNALYPKLCFAFLYTNQNRQNLNANIINLETGDVLNWFCITNINIQILKLDVFSFDAKTKALCGVTEQDECGAPIVFTENAVLGINQTTDMNTTQYLGYALPDGRYFTTQYYNMFLAQSFTTFEDARCSGESSLKFKGIYVEMRGSDNTNKYIVNNNITYKVFGQPRSGWQTVHRPKICVSSEILVR